MFMVLKKGGLDMENQGNMPNKEWLKEEAYRDIKSGMTLGIVGCCICWLPFVGIAGIILGIIGLVKTNRGIKVYGSLGEMAPGRRIPAKILTICAIAFGILLALYYIVIFSVACFAIGEVGGDFNEASDILDNARRYKYY